MVEKQSFRARIKNQPKRFILSELLTVFSEKAINSTIYKPLVACIAAGMLVQLSLRERLSRLRLAWDASKQLNQRFNVRVTASNTIFYCTRRALKTCFVDGQPSIIYHAVLRQRAPLVFSELQLVARANGWTVIEDRRKVSVSVKQERRQQTLNASAYMVLSSLVLQPEATLAAADTVQDNRAYPFYSASGIHAQSIVRPLGLFSASQNNFDQYFNSAIKHAPIDSIAWQQGDYDHSQQAEGMALDYDQADYQQALAILNKKWVSKKSDPHYLAGDIEKIAAYIAARPNAYKLLTSISNQPWTLHHQRGEFRSNIRGNAYSVHSVKIYFDSRSAAVLKSHQACVNHAGHCTASPVDALLHELLHAKLALTDTAEFIRHGGMNSVVYPYKHERKVIALENEMYRAMSQKDQQPRPSRRAHIGKLVAASCATCI